MATELKVRAKEKIYFIDGIREPGLKSRSGEPLDEFYLQKKEHFNPQFMEPLGWIPEMNEEDLLKVKESTAEDGTHITAEAMAFKKSDKLDEEVRKARVTKANQEQNGFETTMKSQKKEKL